MFDPGDHDTTGHGSRSDDGPRGRLSQHDIDRVREAVDIVTLVGATVPLRRSGRSFSGLCPFHAEHSPSFHVTPGRGYYCFGCGEKGSAVEWVMRRDGIDFPAAVRALAASAGIPLGCDVAPTHRPPPSQGRTLRVAKAGSGRAGTTTATTAGDTRVAAPPQMSRPFPRVEWSDNLCSDLAAALWVDPAAGGARDYLTRPRGPDDPEARGLSDATCRAAGLGWLAARDGSGRVVEQWVAVPLRDGRGQPVNVKFRPVPGPCLACSPSRGVDGPGCERCAPPGEPGAGRVQAKPKYRVLPSRALPLYGADGLTPDRDRPVVVVEGELDVLAMRDLGFAGHVVSGTKGAGSFDEQWLDLLEPYRQFVLAYDADDAGDKGARTLSTKLGAERCVRARLPRKDAGDCVAEGIDPAAVALAIREAAPLDGARVVRAGHYAAEIEAAISEPERLVGIPTGSAKLDRCLGGDRPGLTVVTADSGAGKTTFTTWQMFERARMGIPTLVTAFEQSPRRLVEKLLRMQLGCDFTRASAAERQAALAAIDAMPLYVVAHQGRIAYDDLVATLRYAARRLDVRVAMVDHLGYVQDQDARDERRDIERIVQGLALLSDAQLGMSIWLVAHPTGQNVAQQRRVTMGDLKGASAIKQEAFNVLVLERNPLSPSRPHPSVTVHADKVRAEFGSAGSSCWLAFDTESCLYADEWRATPQGARSGGAPPEPPPGGFPPAPRSLRVAREVPAPRAEPATEFPREHAVEDDDVPR